MSKVTQILIIFALLISALLSGCLGARVVQDVIAPVGGQVYALQLGSTLHGMQMAVQGHSGTMMWMKGGNVTFAWAIKDAWAFVSINHMTMADNSDEVVMLLEQGNVTNCAQMNCINQLLTNNGWRVIGPTALSPTLRAAITGATTLMAVSQSLVSILVMPPDAIYMLDEYQQFGGREL